MQTKHSLRLIGALALLGLTPVGAVISSKAGAQTSPAQIAYAQRCENTLSTAVSMLKSWYSTGKYPTGSTFSVWTAAAGFAVAGSDPIAYKAACKYMSTLLIPEATAAWGGGNSGWDSFAQMDTYLRYRTLIQSAPEVYSVNGNLYTLDQLFFRALAINAVYYTYDATSNHAVTNGTARYLAELAWPGQVVNPYGFQPPASGTPAPNTGIGVLQSICAGGPGGQGEYGSPNYGVTNWAPIISIAQLDKNPADAQLAQKALLAYETALIDYGAYYNNGSIDMPNGRGYPITAVFGPDGSNMLPWIYFGGDYYDPLVTGSVANMNYKSYGIYGALVYKSGYMPPTQILALGNNSLFPRRVLSTFGGSQQSGYFLPNMSHYSERTFASWQHQRWTSRVVWPGASAQTNRYSPTVWPIVPTTDETSQTIDLATLGAKTLSGSGTYVPDPTLDKMLQVGQTVLHNCMLSAGTGTARGMVIGYPTPGVSVTPTSAAPMGDGQTWFVVLSADKCHLMLGYKEMFIGITSSAPIAYNPPYAGNTLKGYATFRVAGTMSGNVDPSASLQFAVATEMVDPTSYPGATLGNQFQAFVADYVNRGLPQQVRTYSPVGGTPPASWASTNPAWEYQDGNGNLLHSEFYDGRNFTNGIGVNLVNGQVYNASWPSLLVDDGTGVNLPYAYQSFNTTIQLPGYDAIYYDYQNAKKVNGRAMGLAVSPADTGTFSLSWKSDNNAAGYLIERSLDDTNWQARATVSASTTSYTDTDPTMAEYTWCYYRITSLGKDGTPLAINGVALGPSSPEGYFSLLKAPGYVSATKYATNSIKVSWQRRASGTSSEGPGIEVERSDDNGATWGVVLGNSTQGAQYMYDAADTTVKHLYRVRSRLHYSYSNWSKWSVATYTP